MDVRCKICTKVKPLEEMQLGRNMDRCLACHARRNKNFKRQPYNRNLTAARVAARKLWGGRCQDCDVALGATDRRNTWKLTPTTALGYELLRDHTMLDVYALPSEVLVENFTALCRYDHQRWLAAQEES